MGVADGFAELLQPLPQVTGLGDPQVDSLHLLVVELNLKPQLVLSETCMGVQ